MITEQLWQEWKHLQHDIEDTQSLPEKFLSFLVANARDVQLLDKLWKLLDTAVRFGDIKRAALFAMLLRSRCEDLEAQSETESIDEYLRLSGKVLS